MHACLKEIHTVCLLLNEYLQKLFKPGANLVHFKLSLYIKTITILSFHMGKLVLKLINSFHIQWVAWTRLTEISRKKGPWKGFWGPITTVWETSYISYLSDDNIWTLPTKMNILLTRELPPQDFALLQLPLTASPTAIATRTIFPYQFPPWTTSTFLLEKIIWGATVMVVHCPLKLPHLEIIWVETVWGSCPVPEFTHVQSSNALHSDYIKYLRPTFEFHVTC